MSRKSSLRSLARSMSLPSRNAPAVKVHVRRMYVDCRHGQLHVHTAFPSSGGFDELTPLVCLHPAGRTGHSFDGFLEAMGRDRSVYAPDVPGCGESDAPEAASTVAEYAEACGDLLDSLRLRQVDLLGYQAGALVAAELAIARPGQVRRVVMAGAPVFDAREREAFQARPWPARAREDGTHLLDEWQRSWKAHGSLATVERVAAELGSVLRAGPSAAWAMSAAVHYPAGERLPLLQQPVLLLRTADEFREHTARAESLLHTAARLDVPGQAGALFDAGGVELAEQLRRFLDL